jgi:hypothetical protein
VVENAATRRYEVAKGNKISTYFMGVPCINSIVPTDALNNVKSQIIK